MTLSLPDATRNDAADAVCSLADGGSIEVRSGSKPASANDAATGTLLATFTLPVPAFAAAVAGVATLDADPDLATTWAADGTAGWFRVKSSGGATVFDGTAGTSGADLNLTTVNAVTGGSVSITDGTVTMPA